jgi:hypothetical protein
MADPTETAFAGPLPQLIPLEQDDIVLAALGEEERGSAPDDTAADDDRRGARYSATSS